MTTTNSSGFGPGATKTRVAQAFEKSRNLFLKPTVNSSKPENEDSCCSFSSSSVFQERKNGGFSGRRKHPPQVRQRSQILLKPNWLADGSLAELQGEEELPESPGSAEEGGSGMPNTTDWDFKFVHLLVCGKFDYNIMCNYDVSARNVYLLY